MSASDSIYGFVIYDNKQVLTYQQIRDYGIPVRTLEEEYVKGFHGLNGICDLNGSKTSLQSLLQGLGLTLSVVKVPHSKDHRFAMEPEVPALAFPTPSFKYIGAFVQNAGYIGLDLDVNNTAPGCLRVIVKPSSTMYSSQEKMLDMNKYLRAYLPEIWDYEPVPAPAPPRVTTEPVTPSYPWKAQKHSPEPAPAMGAGSGRDPEYDEFLAYKRAKASAQEEPVRAEPVPKAVQASPPTSPLYVEMFGILLGKR